MQVGRGADGEERQAEEGDPYLSVHAAWPRERWNVDSLTNCSSPPPPFAFSLKSITTPVTVSPLHSLATVIARFSAN